jgi:hypothetical protein
MLVFVGNYEKSIELAQYDMVLATEVDPTYRRHFEKGEFDIVAHELHVMRLSKTANVFKHMIVYFPPAAKFVPPYDFALVDLPNYQFKWPGDRSLEIEFEIIKFIDLVLVPRATVIVSADEQGMNAINTIQVDYFRS